MQDRIVQELNIDRTLVKGGEANEIQRRIDFIKATLRGSGCKALVLGISGGVDSLTAGRLCQLAVTQLRDEDYAARFIAMRLPYKTQADESDAQASLAFITPDQIDTLNIAASVDGLMASLTTTEVSAAHVDFIKGNVKARTRMIAQYAVANLHDGLVVGTDHQAVMQVGHGVLGDHPRACLDVALDEIDMGGADFSGGQAGHEAVDAGGDVERVDLVRGDERQGGLGVAFVGLGFIRQAHGDEARGVVFVAQLRHCQLAQTTGREGVNTPTDAQYQRLAAGAAQSGLDEVDAPLDFVGLTALHQRAVDIQFLHDTVLHVTPPRGRR